MKKFQYKNIIPKIIPKKIVKSKIFKFEWEGQINFTSKGLKYTLKRIFKKYLKKLLIKEINKIKEK